MIIPIRCFTCGKVIANKQKQYKTRVDALKKERGMDSTQDIQVNSDDLRDSVEKIVMDELGLHRQCCRRMILTHVDLVEKL